MSSLTLQWEAEEKAKKAKAAKKRKKAAAKKDTADLDTPSL